MNIFKFSFIYISNSYIFRFLILFFFTSIFFLIITRNISYCQFNNTIGSDKKDVNSTDRYKSTTFHDTTFNDIITLSMRNIGDTNSLFSNSHFNKDFIFNNNRVFTDISFESSTFLANVYFDSTTFNYDIKFDNASFFLKASFRYICLRPSSDLYFFNIELPDTIDFSFVKLKSQKVYFDNVRMHKYNDNRKCQIILTGTNTRNLEIDFNKLHIFIPKNTSIEDINKIFLPLISRYRNENPGIADDLDIQRLDEIRLRSALLDRVWLSVRKYFYNYGYNIGHILLYSVFLGNLFLTVLTLFPRKNKCRGIFVFLKFLSFINIETILKNHHDSILYNDSPSKVEKNNYYPIQLIDHVPKYSNIYYKILYYRFILALKFVFFTFLLQRKFFSHFKPFTVDTAYTLLIHIYGLITIGTLCRYIFK
jgi:hypothetical protein